MTPETPGNSGERRLCWDGLGLAVPASWEPARLGLGYVRLEDASGPRLTLRWQRLKKPASPERVLARLSRRKILRLDKAPHGAVEAVLAALPRGMRATPCADASGRGADAVLMSLEDERMAVLAAIHSHPDEPAAPWVRAVSSLTPEPSGRFDLYDVRGEAPPGFALASFAVNLGHYHFRYRSGGDFLDFHRFAPAEVILRSKSLEGWALEVFGQELERRGRRGFVPGSFDGYPAARFADTTPGGPAGPARGDDAGSSGRDGFVPDSAVPRGLAAAGRLLAARMFSAFRFARAMAWMPDGAKILAAVARHKGDLSPEAFEEVCRRYVVQA